MIEYHLHLRSLDHGVPESVRLRRLLKAALRSFGFRCTSIEQIGIAQASEGIEPTISPDEPSTRQRGGKREGRVLPGGSARRAGKRLALFARKRDAISGS